MCLSFIINDITNSPNISLCFLWFILNDKLFSFSKGLQPWFWCGNMESNLDLNLGRASLGVWLVMLLRLEVLVIFTDFCSFSDLDWCLCKVISIMKFYIMVMFVTRCEGESLVLFGYCLTRRTRKRKTGKYFWFMCFYLFWKTHKTRKRKNNFQKKTIQCSPS